MKKIDLDNFLIDIKEEANSPYLSPFKLWFQKMMDAKHGIEFIDFESRTLIGRTCGAMALIKSDFQDCTLEVKNDYKKLITTLEELYIQHPILFGEEDLKYIPCEGDMVYAYARDIKDKNVLISMNNGKKVIFTGGYNSDKKPVVEYSPLLVASVDVISDKPLLTLEDQLLEYFNSKIIEEQCEEYMNSKTQKQLGIKISDLIDIVKRNEIKMPTMQEVEKVFLEKFEKGWTGIGHTFEVLRHFIERK